MNHSLYIPSLYINSFLNGDTNKYIKTVRFVMSYITDSPHPVSINEMYEIVNISDHKMDCKPFHDLMLNLQDCECVSLIESVNPYYLTVNNFVVTLKNLWNFHVLMKNEGFK